MDESEGRLYRGVPDGRVERPQVEVREAEQPEETVPGGKRVREKVGRIYWKRG